MTPPPDILERMRRVKLILLDVDGVCTDGRIGYGPSGDSFRQFHVRDGSALKLAQAAGIPVGLITGRRTAATARWAQDLGLAEVHQGCRIKAPVWHEILERRGLDATRVAYMGDDVLDLGLLQHAGLAATPADACPEAQALSHYRSSRPGGAGCVRELVEGILRAQGRWEELITTSFWPDDREPQP